MTEVVFLQGTSSIMRPHRGWWWLLLCLAAFPRAAAAQWLSNGNPVCVYPGDQSYPVTATDGAGGAFVVWVDSRSGTADLYVQRITATGAIAAGWSPTGDTLCVAANDQRAPAIVADGAGGAFVTWEDDRAGINDTNISLQRIASSGAPAAGWPAGGIAICAASGFQTKPAIALESGSAIVAWQDDRGATTDIYAQKVSAAGIIQWTANGAPVCLAVGPQTVPAIAGDGAGGAIVFWQDDRGGNTGDIYGQRLNASGVAQWAVDGLPICTASNDQLAPLAIGDAAGGAIVTWEDYRSGNADVFAQRVNGSGTSLWTANGLALCTDVAEQYVGQPVSDGAGGAIVPWVDFRFGAGSLYAQKVAASGAIGWQMNGQPVCTVGDVSDPVASPDGTGGAIFVWADGRAGGNGVDLYGERLTSSGAVGSGWTAGGTLVCNALGDQLLPAVTTDGGGSVIASWFDGRNGNNDIYAKRLASGGSAVDVPPAAPSSLELSAAPNPMTSSATVRFSIAQPEHASLEVLDVTGRVVRVLIEPQLLPAGARSASWDGRDDRGAAAPAGLYWIRLVTGTQTRVRMLARLR